MEAPEDASTPRQRFSILTNWFGQDRTHSSETTQASFLSIHSINARDVLDPIDGGKTYTRTPAEYDHPIWRLGWTDGKSGQLPSVNEKLLEAHARIEWSQRIREAEEQVARSTQEIDLLNGEKEASERERDEIQTQYKEIDLKRTAHLQDFSRKQAWSYLLFGVVTLLADIPLSLRLVAAGFGVKTTAKVHGHSLSADDILSFQFFEVLRHFWEAIVLALGIAFASIVIKYFLDIVVFRDRELSDIGLRSSGRELEQHQEPFHAEHLKGSETGEWALEIPRLVSRVSWVAVLLFISTTICLGIFRYQIQPQVDKYEREVTRHEDKLQRIDAKYDELLSSFEDDNDGPIKAREEATKLVNAEAVEIPPPDFKSRWGLPTFVLLTLLLPIATAICFSIAGKKLRNARLFETLTTRRNELSIKIRSIAEDLSQKHSELAAHKATLETGTRPDGQMNLLQSCQYLYLHGYERGAKNVPETAEAKTGSIYELAVKYFQRVLSQRFR